MRVSAQNINRTQGKSTQELTQLMTQVLALAKKQGASDAAVGVSHDHGFSVDVRLGSVETVAFSEDKEISVTVYIGQRKGSASSTDTRLPALETMVRAAIDIAKVSAVDPCSGLADQALINNDYPELDIFHPWQLAPDEAIELALTCESQALAMDKRIVNSDGVNLSTYQFLFGYANTYGCLGVMQGTRHSMSCCLIAKEGDLMQRDYDYTTARRHEDLIATAHLAKNACERSVRRLGARKIKTQKAPVVFSSRVSRGLIASFIDAISGGNLYRKNTFLLDSLGQKIFPSGITIYEQPHLLRGLGSAVFDGEGVPTRPNVFVEDGRVQQYVLGSYTARKLGLATTANSGGVYNLTVTPTAGAFADVLQKMGTGLLVTELMGHGVNTLTGDYSRGASGFWVENGEIQFPVEEITIAGNLRSMFAGIEAVGQDLDLNSATRCGSILINEMMIAGD